MGTMRTRISGVTVLALLLLSPAAGSASATPAADPPTPLPVGAQLTARPGEQLTFTAPSHLPGMNGKWVISKAFIRPGTLRMNDPVMTAVATVACDTPPGVYAVETNMPDGPAQGIKANAWVTVNVADIGEAERGACPGKVAALPPEPLEERWPVSDSWPQSPWDVRTFQPGAKVTPTAMAEGYDKPLTSPGFTDKPVMRGAKAVVTATAVIRCDAAPGLYEVRWVGRDEVWARYRVARTDDAARHGCQDEAEALATRQVTAWSLGAAALAVAGAVTYALVRRRRRVSP
ncbi:MULTISPECIES: hypothetical protein [unclassified Streptomyces]|uniref:hypothetical protein n=1 Tax=unclassified Streptomyces TaxID=2593676 RepID=UPI001BEA4FDD|nr:MULTISPECIES: hypothetical protein [unclassified Streptomyces]MBT2404452.1 hypothetical protein [Streptomyces sp. ISL-21]MBT2612494.1 hypothetical protein [Streptomyces sp. ISL-87]